MPKKEKTSFFGKIMGGSVTEEPMIQPVSQYQEEVVEAEELSPDDAVEERELEVEEEVIMPRQQTQTTQTKESAQPNGNGNEEWLSDFEGQLNIDMYQTKDNVIIKSTIAGVRPDDIDITVANDMLTVKGSRRKDEMIPQDDYFYQECYWGNFSRSVIIPVDIESESIEADLKDGILTIIIPKAAKAKTKKVKVKGL
ncbi:MAG: Hsp20/alpha crystallin family protein [Candidatus Doudnabacteria bacterium]|nr:Hsp20/alpha crystallin family protein [Candidatus Doudnabacteria bacterium]